MNPQQRHGYKKHAREFGFFSLFIFSILFTSLAFGNSGSIKGIIHWTGNPKPQEIIVQLDTYQSEEPFLSQRTRANAKGEFMFASLPLKENYIYQITPIVFDHAYPAVQKSFKRDRTLNVEFNLAPVTSDLNVLSLSETMEISAGKAWKIKHDLTLSNSGLLPFETNPQNFIAIPLLQGGYDLALIEGLERSNVSVDEENDTLLLALQLLPGTTQHYVFSYSYIPTTRTISFNKSSNLPMSKKTILSPTSFGFKSKTFEKQNPNSQFKMHTFNHIAANQMQSFSITRVWMKNDLLHFFILLFVLILFVGGILSYRIIPLSQLTDAQWNDAYESLVQDFNNKKIDEPTFNNRRKKLEMVFLEKHGA